MSDLRAYTKDLLRLRINRSPEERLQLGQRAKNDPAAMRALIESVLPFAFSIAKRFWFKHQSLRLEDVVQDANEAVLLAAQEFDPAYGIQFITWAGERVRLHLRWRWSFVNRPLRKAPLVSLQATVKPNDEGYTWDEVLAGDSDTEQEWAKLELRRLVEERLKKLRLTPREQHLLRMRVMAARPATLEEIAMTNGVSRQRIQVCEARLLAKLRRRFRDLREAA